ncbi:branched-chain amino acid ABC transporter permease [Lichenibacterium dinghuense]|uniref:branched-chain amino acid ABC transporter permease n=1 Tax=Lichenibacterium dinghuense TaxID=2895977 RepID=UPI001F1BAD64|nr:branched-chain amino acid ABC transporter permease [Lichenibacterium sp. 6Y81]
MRPALLALCLVPLLAGCARTADRDEAAACASAAAGLATPVRVRVLAVSPLGRDADGRSGVRLALRPEDPDIALTSLTCRFEPNGGRPALATLDTQRGPVDDTHLILLRRFWLGSEEAAEAERDADDGEAIDAGLPALPIRVAYLFQQALNALPDAAVYGLLGAAYSLVYGLSGRINFAFGEIAAVGGVAAVVAGTLSRDAPAGVALALAGVLGLYAAALCGAAVEHGVLWRLRRVTGQQGLVATLGVALALREYLRLATGSQPLWVAPLLAEPLRLAHAGGFVVTVTPVALVLAGTAAAASAGLLAAFRYTGFGRDWRASADDPLAAALVGVDPRRLSLRTTALASALVGLAGAGVTLNYGGVGFDYTTGLGLRALIAAILGGIGSGPGAFLGGIGIALVEAAWSAYFPVGDRDLAVDVLLVLALVVRPGGLLGSREPAPRRAL